jgi:hypothetical protein
MRVWKLSRLARRFHWELFGGMWKLGKALAQFIASHALPPLLVSWDLLTQVARIVPETSDRFSFRRFWGDGSLSAEPYFVMDSYENVRLRNDFRKMEMLAAPEHLQRFTGSEIVYGAFSPQAAAMLTALFWRHTGKVLRVAADTDPRHGGDSILISYGTADSNFKTFEIEAGSGSVLCQFLANASGRRAFRLGGQFYSMESRGGVAYDKAILLRLTGQPDANHCHVVCAGLSEWGSLAAVYYLTRKWKELHKRFDRFGRRRDFCVLLEVECGQFENAREVISAVSWESKRGPDPAFVFSSHV